MIILKYTLSLCLLLLAISATAEKLYKWTDEDGNVQYSQTPPKDADAEKISVEGNGDDATKKRYQEQKKRLDELANKRQEAKDKKAKAKSEAKENAALCEQAKSRLASYQRARVNVTNDDGSQRRLAEEERIAQVKQSQDDVNEFCQ